MQYWYDIDAVRPRPSSGVGLSSPSLVASGMPLLDWLEEELDGFDDDYLITDCPGLYLVSVYRSRGSCSSGRIELYTHHPLAQLVADGHKDLCGISPRILVYGRPLHVFQVSYRLYF